MARSDFIIKKTTSIDKAQALLYPALMDINLIKFYEQGLVPDKQP